MSDILNYQFPDPLDSFNKAVAAGIALNQQRQQQQARVAAQQGNQVVVNPELELLRMEARNRLMQPGATSKDFLRYGFLFNKDEAEIMLKTGEALRDDERLAILEDSGELLSALVTGNKAFAEKRLTEEATAARKMNNERGALELEGWLNLIRNEPDGMRRVRDALSMQVSFIPDGGKVIESINKLEEEHRLSEEHRIDIEEKKSDAAIRGIEERYKEREIVADLRKKGFDTLLTGAEIGETLARTRKLDAETSLLNLELETYKVGGKKIPQEKIFEMERRLRDEYRARTVTFESLREDHANIVKSAELSDGAGDFSIVVSFVKMLDPGSVVRESEYGQAVQTAGFYDRLLALAAGIQQGDKLSPRHRLMFVRLANEFMESSRRREREVRRDMAYTADYWGIHKRNVFGARAEEDDVPPLFNPERFRAMLTDIEALRTEYVPITREGRQIQIPPTRPAQTPTPTRPAQTQQRREASDF